MAKLNTIVVNVDTTEARKKLKKLRRDFRAIGGFDWRAWVAGALVGGAVGVAATALVALIS
jgi:hypothetical protein